MNNNGLDINILEAYLKGTLDPKAMHQVEKEALEDPFVAEALEGLSHSAAYAQNFSLLQKQLQERVAEEKTGKKTRVITWQRLSIAAAASVVFISVGIMFLMKGTNTVEQSAKKEGVEVQLTPLASDSTPVVATIELPENELEKAKVVAAAPAKKVAVPEKVEEAIDAAISDATPTAIAKNTVKQFPKEEVVMRSLSKKETASDAPAMAPTALQSRVKEITVPIAQGKAVSPKDGRTPVADPIVKPELGNKPETLAYAAEVKTLSSHSLSTALKDNNDALNEVAISGYSRFTPSKAGPVPAVDHAAYTSYLNKNNKLYTGNVAGQYVELSFTVAKTGKPENIKVLKGLAQRYNEEAIRLLTDGPKWIVPRKASNKASLKVYF